MQTFLGVDGGGTKTEFVLVDEGGRILARHQAGSAYYLEIGVDALQSMIGRGIAATLESAGLAPGQLTYAFFGLPAYGEDSRLLSRLDTVASPALESGRYQCGNDMVCAWAGALACQDGINIVAGTGSIAYGEFAGRQARGGGWGELFSDEGSAYWVAREGLNLFSRMSDGRVAKGPLYQLMQDHYHLASDLDICAAVYGQNSGSRSQIAQLATVVARAAREGDAQSKALFTAGARELAAIVEATRARLSVPEDVSLPVSYSGGMFKLRDLVLEPFEQALSQSRLSYQCVSPRLPPDAGAALYAAKCSGAFLTEAALESLRRAVL